MHKCNVSQLPDDLQYLGEENPPRTEKELSYTPRPQIVSADICRYTIEMSRWRLQISFLLNEIQKLRDRLALYNWQLVEEVRADAAKILAADDCFISRGVK